MIALTASGEGTDPELEADDTISGRGNSAGASETEAPCLGVEGMGVDAGRIRRTTCRERRSGRRIRAGMGIRKPFREI